MTTRNKTIEIPEELFLRLEEAARAKQVDTAQFIENLLETEQQNKKQSAVTESSSAPIYRIHEFAVDTGITDFAQNVDHYLYNHEVPQDNS